MKTLTLLLLLLLGGCAGAQHAGHGRCDVARVRPFVGALGTSEIGRAALARSGAHALRWIAPGAMVTMDYRTDRLNLRVDARNFVIAVDCG